jgi:rare lipoprotein A
MLKRPEATDMGPKKPLPFWLLVATSCLAAAGMLCTLTTRTVQADAGLSRSSGAPSATVVRDATPHVSTPAQKPRSKLLRGIASWYGDQFDGKKTASGEMFSQDELTACHPTLPFGSEVRVVNLRNHKSVVVRITDRAELVKGRVIDLSHAAADKLNMTRSGLARVSIEVLSVGHPVMPE